jgi:hypothetical protein
VRRALAFLLMRRGLGQFWLLLTVPFGLAIVLAQWSPLLMAGALSVPLSWALACKPTIGLALFAWRPSWKSATVCAALLAIGFFVNPFWVGEWWQAARRVPGHGAPITHAFGFLPPLALLRWRNPAARLVVIMTLMPQNLDFYDHLPLFFAATSGAELFGLTALSWIAWGGTRLQCSDPYFCGTQAAPWIIALLYLPATLLVLRPGRRETFLGNGYNAVRLTAVVRSRPQLSRYHF